MAPPPRALVSVLLLALLRGCASGGADAGTADVAAEVAPAALPPSLAEEAGAAPWGAEEPEDCAEDAGVCALTLRQLRARQAEGTISRHGGGARWNGGAAEGEVQDQLDHEEVVRTLEALADWLPQHAADEDTPWNSTLFNESWNTTAIDKFGALTRDLPQEVDASNVSDASPWEAPPWRGQAAPELEEADDPYEEGLGSMSAIPGPSCKKYGCIKYNKYRLDRTCQCNHACREHNDCCHDYHEVCSPHGGGMITAERVWVAMLKGTGDKKFQRMLCGIVAHFTHHSICHNGLIFLGTVRGRRDYWFLEYGNSGIPDVLTGRVKWGLMIAPAKSRFGGKPLLVREIWPDTSKLKYAVQVIRETPYWIDIAAVLRLLNRSAKKFNKHLWCSDFVAEVLVRIGCLRNDHAAWNANPNDFSIKSHRLHWTCPVGPEYWWDTRQR